MASAITLFLLLVAPALASAATGAWEIDTYGNGDMLKSAFEAIAAFSAVNGGMTSAIKLISLVAFLGALGSAATGLLTGRSPFLMLPYTIVAAGLISSLSMVPATVVIHDQVAVTDDVIANIPLPLAVIGNMTSTFGQRLAQQVEQAIQPADIERFTSTGLGWGPRVIQATLNAAPMDQKVLTDLDAFIRLCVIPDVQMNRKTIDQLVNATTVDAILGDTNPAIAVLLPSQCDSNGLPTGCTPPSSDDQRCPDAYGYLDNELTQAAGDPGFLQTIATQIGTPYAQVASSIGDVTNSVLQVSQDGFSLLKLRFVTNQLLPSVQAYAAIGGQSATLTAWSVAEAQNQQVSSWLNIGLILQQTLPIFHAALEFLFYAFMLFAIPLIVLKPKLLIDMVATALWLQLWPLAYIFGNLFLYKQLDKISFMTAPSGMNLGLSYTTTQPLTSTIQSAYAASGFPVMIGILMIGGVLFGGSYAMTRAISAGPFGAGAGFGTAAALGNVSAGNATVGAFNARRATTDDQGHPGYETITGTPGVPIDLMSRTMSTGSGGMEMIGERGTGTFAITDTAPGQGGLVTSASAQGLQANAPMFELRGSEQTQTTRAQAYTTAKAKTEQSLQQLGRTISDATQHALRITEGASEQTGWDEVTAKRDAVRHSHQQAIERALTESGQFQAAQEQAQAHGVDLKTGLAGKTPGVLELSLGTHGEISAHDSTTKQEVFRLTGDQGRRFEQAYAHELTTDTQHSKALHELEQATQTKGLDFTLGDVRQSLQQYQTNQREEQAAQQSWQESHNISRILQQNQLPAFIESVWREEGHPGTFSEARRSANPELQAESRAFFEHLNARFNDNNPEIQERLAHFAAAHDAPGAAAVHREIEAGTDGMAHIEKAPEGPRTADRFTRDILGGQDAHGPDRRRMRTREHHVERVIADKMGSARAKADDASEQTAQVPTAHQMETDRHSGRTPQPSALQERAMIVQMSEVGVEAGHQLKDTATTAWGWVTEAGKTLTEAERTPEETPPDHPPQAQ